MAITYTGDKQISGDLEQARIVSRKKAHRDLDLSLKIHPIRKDIIPLKDDAAIKNAVKNLIITNAFERPFGDDKGANLRALLFEPSGFMTEIGLKDAVKRVIEKYEPRVRVNQVIVIDNSESNEYILTVIFRIKEFDFNSNVEIVLRRLR